MQDFVHQQYVVGGFGASRIFRGCRVVKLAGEILKGPTVNHGGRPGADGGTEDCPWATGRYRLGRNFGFKVQGFEV